MKRRTEINIELTRTSLIRHPHAAPCWCAACAGHGELTTSQDAAVLIDVNTRLVAESSEAGQDYLIENAESGEAIEIDSAEGQLILAAAARSLEQRLLPEARARISASQDTLVLNRTKRNFFFRKLQSFYRFSRPQALRFARKEK